MSLVRFRPEAPTGDKYLLPTYADLAHLVERNLAKVEVAGSSPVIRSILFSMSAGSKEERYRASFRWTLATATD